MKKFKVGDKVKFNDTSWFHFKNRKRATGKIVKIFCDFDYRVRVDDACFDKKKHYGFREDHLKLVIPFWKRFIRERKPKKFKVGDKVKFVKDEGYGFWDIDLATGIIVKVGQDKYLVTVDDKSFVQDRPYSFFAESLEKI